jgi:hypothetical protein
MSETGFLIDWGYPYKNTKTGAQLNKRTLNVRHESSTKIPIIKSTTPSAIYQFGFRIIGKG